MKNILILSKIYPADDLKYGDTPVVHYFARQWANMGYNVLVIHNFALFPRFFYLFTSHFASFLSSKIGSVVPSVYDDSTREYEYDGITVVRIPIKKIVPHGMFPDSSVACQFMKITSVLDAKSFVPDVVVGHWWNPQLPLIARFKSKYDCRTAMIVHDVDESKAKPEYTRYYDSVDSWGFRSIPLQKQFEKIVGSSFKSFHCASGIPSEYITGNSHRLFDNKLINIVFVGQLIKRKHPASILDAIDKLDDGDQYNVLFVGTGNESNHLKAMSSSMPNVSFTGRLPRNEVTVCMKQSDIFIMISRAEAFGLVYLEAMGCGCITVASKYEGMDGIIKDGVNGFLCKAGDSDELASILKRISLMTTAELKAISDRAVETASYYTDQLAAQRYLENIIE